jgi:hypothetical protein
VHAVGGVAGLQVELAGRLRHLLEHEVGVEEYGLVLDLLPRLAEQVEGALVHELDADLARQPPPALVKGRHRVLREDLVSGHAVDEHGSSW